MRPFLPLASVVLAGALLGGCGGGGGFRSNRDDDSDFEGRYTGTFVSRDGTVDGTLQLTVDRDGDIAGTATDSRRTGAGTIDRNLSAFRGTTLNLTLGYADATTDTFVGRVDRGADDLLTGTVQERDGNGAILFTVTLTPTS